MGTENPLESFPHRVLIIKELQSTSRGYQNYSGPHVQDSFPPNLSCRTDVHRSGLALPQPRRSGR